MAGSEVEFQGLRVKIQGFEGLKSVLLMFGIRLKKIQKWPIFSKKRIFRTLRDLSVSRKRDDLTFEFQFIYSRFMQGIIRLATFLFEWTG